MSIRALMCVVGGVGVLGTSAMGQTLQLDDHVYRVESGLMFDISNIGASSFAWSWTDFSGMFVDIEDPTIVLVTGQTYLFRRTTGSHPFVVTDDTLEVTGTDGFFARVSTDGTAIEAAALEPLADWMADPAPTSDFIMWTPGAGDIGEYYYTCAIPFHTGMTGRIVVEGPADPRDVQIVGADFENQVLEVMNVGPSAQDLSGWRFCSHDSDEVRRYTAPTGLDGVILGAGESISIYFHNDAPMDPGAMNRSDLGGFFATPLDSDAYGIQLYRPGSTGSVSFGDSTLITDHVQWNIGGSGAGGSETRTAQAVSEGLWLMTGEFVSTTMDTRSISLTDPGDGRLHGDANYSADEPCAPDLTGDGQLDFFDVSFLLQNGVDYNGDTMFDFFDISSFLQEFSVGCP